MSGKRSSIVDELNPGEGNQMRVFKIVAVSVMMAASLVAGVAASAPAATGAPVATRWCC
jgi:hypothetical protein